METYQPPTIQMADLDLYWLAGLLEGDGSFRLKGRDPVITLGMTDEDIVVRATQIMGTNYYRKGPKHGGIGKKPMYRTETSGPRAHALMLRLKPVMGIRRQQQITNATKDYDGPHIGEKHGNAKITNEQAREIRRLWRAKKYTQKQLGEMFGISAQHAGRIGRGDRWKWLE